MQRSPRGSSKKRMLLFIVSVSLTVAAAQLWGVDAEPSWEPRVPSFRPAPQPGAASVAQSQPTVDPGPVDIPEGLDPALIIPTRLAPTGIRERQWGPFPSAFVAVENVWQEYINGGLVQVYAIWLREEPRQAFLDIYAFKQNAAHLEGSFPTPRAVGPVRIVAANGLVLTLASASGEQFLFDVGLGRYLDLSEVATPTTPTLTPSITVPYPASTATGLPPINIPAVVQP